MILVYYLKIITQINRYEKILKHETVKKIKNALSCIHDIDINKDHTNLKIDCQHSKTSKKVITSNAISFENNEKLSENRFDYSYA